MKTTKSTHILLIIIVAGFLSISAAFETSAFEKITMEAAVKKDTLPMDIDRHLLISVGGGLFSSNNNVLGTQGRFLAMLGLEYPLDRNRNWNLEIAYFRLFYSISGKTEDTGVLSFRRYLLSQEYITRPSVHVGLGDRSIDIGAAIDVTVLRRLLYAQLCLRVPVHIVYTHQSGDGMPTMLTVNARIML